MDFIARSDVNIANSVYIEGVTNTKIDDEIKDCLSRYGRIKNVVSVSDINSKYYKNLIIEFETEEALKALEPLLPYTHQSKEVPDVKFHVKSLVSECGAIKGSPPEDYLHELKLIADRSGKSLEEVMKGVMDQIGKHLEKKGQEDDFDVDYKNEQDEDDDDEDDVDEESVDNEGVNGGKRIEQRGFQVPVVSQTPVSHSRLSAHSHTDQRRRSVPNTSLYTNQGISLSGDDINPPEVQRIVVEHIVRKDDLSAQSISSLKLRTFSGKIPKPGSEADYDSWRSHIELLLADPSLSALYVARRISESLLPPAADLVKGFGPNALPIDFLHVLDSAFGTVEDGEELFARFLNTLQNHGELPSAYLQRLHLALSTVEKRGGISVNDMNKHLLKQFCRGCWDNAVIMKLQLEHKRDNPPAFSELLLQLRTEEDRQLTKESLMKKHMPSMKQRAALQFQTASSSCCCDHSDSSAIEDLKKQLNQLQRQMTALLNKKSSSSHQPETHQRHAKSKSKVSSSLTKPKPWFCFRCGEDGHIAPSCSNPENASLVNEKRKQLKQKQQAWDAKQSKAPSN